MIRTGVDIRMDPKGIGTANEFSITGGAPGVSVQKTLGAGHYTVTGAPGEVMRFWDLSHIRW